MPCYSVQTCSVSLDRADIGLLERALQELGYTVYSGSGTKTLTFSKDGVSGSYRNSKLEFQYSSSGKKPDPDAIKRAYSKEVILQKATDYAADGWELERDGDDWILSNPRHNYGATVNA
jgi:hypothetical protein